MATLKQVVDAYNYVEKKINELDLAVQALSRVASDATGVELHADVCAGDEIEFRLNDEYGQSDAFSCIRIEEVLEMAKAKSKQTKTT